MKNLTFIISFIITIITLSVIYTSLLIMVDPKQTIGIRINNPFSPYHENFVLKKREQIALGLKDFDTIILGSSTSEAFYPVDVDYHLNSKSFSASTGGGQTPIRYTMFKAAVEDYPLLKRIIYVVDLFEFNHNVLPGEFLYNKELARLSAPLDLNTNFLQFLRFHFSNQILESIFNVVKKKDKKSETLINSDGTTSRSMILSPLGSELPLEYELNAEMKKNLLAEVEENFYTYSNQVLNNFEYLNPDVLGLFRRFNEETRENNIEIVYVLAAYQYDFNQKLNDLDSVSQMMKQWRDLFSSFEVNDHVIIIDLTDEEFAKNPNSAVWRDGIHFNRAVANKVLSIIKMKLQ